MSRRRELHPRNVTLRRDVDGTWVTSDGHFHISQRGQVGRPWVITPVSPAASLVFRAASLRKRFTTPEEAQQDLWREIYAPSGWAFRLAEAEALERGRSAFG